MAGDLSDQDVSERLSAALEALGLGYGATTTGSTTLEAARRALVLLQIGLHAAMESGGANPVISKPPAPPEPPEFPS